jgi:periplasmic divalent cation tolerance protein
MLENVSSIAERVGRMASETVLVLTTCGNDEDARVMARALVERRLAACVNAVGNVASTYRWEGRVQEDRETLLIVKTTKARLPELEAAIREHSRYELPELIVIDIETGSSAYLEWVRESVATLTD